MTQYEDLESIKKEVAELKSEIQSLQHSILLKICTNSLAKEEYNFRLLLELFDRLGLKKPFVGHTFDFTQSPSETKD